MNEMPLQPSLRYEFQLDDALTLDRYVDIGGSPNHLARKPVPLQSEQQTEPWKIMTRKEFLDVSF